MIRTLNLFASGLASLSTVLVPRAAHACRESMIVVPTNTPIQAIAGDMLRVGAQVRMAQDEQKKMRQSEFAFPS